MNRAIGVILLLGCCLGFPFSGEAEVPVQLHIPFSDRYSANSVIVPFELVDGLIILRARVNEEEGHFIFDTGASGLVLNEAHFAPERTLSGREGVGLSGATSRVGERLRNHFTLDELVFPEVYAQTIDLQHLEERKKMRILGLIGYEIIREFEIMFNYHRRFLTISALDDAGNVLIPLPHTLEKIDSIDFRLGHHIPVLEVVVDGRRKQMGLDSGASYNLLNIRRNKDVMKHFKIRKKVDILGAGDRPSEALIGRLYKVVIRERFKCAAMHTVLTNLRSLEAIYQTELHGILGYPFLAPWLTSINYKKQRFYFHQFNRYRP